jgi:hypothetical protein
VHFFKKKTNKLCAVAGVVKTCKHMTWVCRSGCCTFPEVPTKYCDRFELSKSLVIAMGSTTRPEPERLFKLLVCAKLTSFNFCNGDAEICILFDFILSWDPELGQKMKGLLACKRSVRVPFTFHLWTDNKLV